MARRDTLTTATKGDVSRLPARERRVCVADAHMQQARVATVEMGQAPTYLHVSVFMLKKMPYLRPAGSAFEKEQSCTVIRTDLQPLLARVISC